ncbi:MAG: hypothetical protein GY847_41095 [Proteobacteria bacterium]|nr:hypothetical protein [Pseudomonadota bacterium]
MKLLTFVFINFALFTFTGVVAAQGQVEEIGVTKQPVGAKSPSQKSPSEKVDVCAGITCSGHGSCVHVSGNPVCACNEGYRTDPVSKLGCLPLQIAEPVIVNPQQPSKSLLSQTDYEAAIKQRKIGASMMAIGIVSLTVTGVLFGALVLTPEDGSQYNCGDDGCSTVEGNDGKRLAMNITSIATLGLGLGLTIPGVIKRRRGGRIIRQFESQQKTQSSVAPIISPFFSLSPRCQGAGLRVSF